MEGLLLSADSLVEGVHHGTLSDAHRLRGRHFSSLREGPVEGQDDADIQTHPALALGRYPTHRRSQESQKGDRGRRAGGPPVAVAASLLIVVIDVPLSVRTARPEPLLPPRPPLDGGARFGTLPREVGIVLGVPAPEVDFRGGGGHPPLRMLHPRPRRRRRRPRGPSPVRRRHLRGGRRLVPMSLRCRGITTVRLRCGANRLGK